MKLKNEMREFRILQTQARGAITHYFFFGGATMFKILPGT